MGELLSYEQNAKRVSSGFDATNFRFSLETLMNSMF